MSTTPAAGGFISLAFEERPVEEMRHRATRFYDLMRRRRTVRDFSDRPVPADVIEHALLTAGSAPSGAHRQPWHFVVVTDPAKKAEIREAAPDLVESIDLFDVYRGDQVEAGKRSLAFALRLRSADRTLEDGDADRVLTDALERLRGAFGARLRQTGTPRRP